VNKHNAGANASTVIHLTARANTAVAAAAEQHSCQAAAITLDAIKTQVTVSAQPAVNSLTGHSGIRYSSLLLPRWRMCVWASCGPAQAACKCNERLAPRPAVPLQVIIKGDGAGTKQRHHDAATVRKHSHLVTLAAAAAAAAAAGRVLKTAHTGCLCSCTLTLHNLPCWRTFHVGVL
jgi:hypothetical protein